MTVLRIVSVVGARPNFMKIAPFVRAIEGWNRRGRSPTLEHFLVHTGQHYDASMSEAFFATLGIPRPDVNLGVGSGSHAEQVGQTMIAFERVVREQRPDWVVVVGDVNATCACAITARKELVRLAHIEAGLRSFDPTMPEEINRIVTDRLADLLLTPDAIADRNLAAEGVGAERIRRVGNIMIDTLTAMLPQARGLDIGRIVARNLVDGLRARRPPIAAGADYAVLTLHRPSNVDSPATLGPLVDLFTGEIARRMPLVWTLHPRTRRRLEEFGLWQRVAGCEGIHLVEPLDYCEMLRLNLGAQVMLTDSGGLQEECCVLGTPCVTLRENTERPITLREHGGASTLAGNDPGAILAAFELGGKGERHAFCPPLWDGHTAERVVAALAEA